MEIVNPSKQYRHDHTGVFSCQYHVVFCPKYRRPVLETEIAERLKEWFLEKQDEYGDEVLDLDVMPHTSRTLRKEFPSLKSKLPTLWTRSKCISSVGTVTLEVVKRYIADQKGV